MSTPELRNTQLRYSEGGMSRPSVSYVGVSGFAGAGASAAAQRRRAAAEAVRPASRLGEKRILMLLGDVVGRRSDENKSIMLPRSSARCKLRLTGWSPYRSLKKRSHGGNSGLLQENHFFLL